MNSMMSNGSPFYHEHQKIDEGIVKNFSSSYHERHYVPVHIEHHESVTLNDPSLSLSPSLNRRSVNSKRLKLSTSGQFDLLKGNTSQTTDLLSPNHQTSINDDVNGMNQPKQQRKLDPRPCAECGKILFSDKTHLLHCQTHAKIAKQCWICGLHDNDMKKHILTEHGNQKFSTAGFKV
jgi:hypothetical protein